MDENCTEISDSASHVMTESIVSPTHFEQGFTEHTCTICGYSYIDSITEVIPHTFGNWQNNDAQTHIKICDCGEIVTENHSWDEGRITTEPTFDSDDIKTFTCTQCGATNTQSLPFEESKSEEQSILLESTKLESPQTGEDDNIIIIMILCSVSAMLCFFCYDKEIYQKIKFWDKKQKAIHIIMDSFLFFIYTCFI